MPSALVETGFVTFTPSPSSFFTNPSSPFTSRANRSRMVPLLGSGPAAAAAGGGVVGGAAAGGAAGAPAGGAPAGAPPAPPRPPPRPPPPPPPRAPPPGEKSREIHLSAGVSSALGTPPLRREFSVAPKCFMYQARPSTLFGTK